MSNHINEEKNLILKDEEKLVLDHNYDGIQELDHPLPGWWLAIFYISIAFSAVYVAYYMTGIGPTLRDEMNATLQEFEAKKPQMPAASSAPNDDALLAMVADKARVQSGAEVFAGKCAACHGAQGQGQIGPNLTDDFWIHGGGGPSDIMKVVRDGVADKGMPPWGPVLKDDEMINVMLFIRSIHGTNPPNAKEPQGAQQPWKTAGQ